MCEVAYSYVAWLMEFWFFFSFSYDASICDMTHSYVTWLSYVRCGSFIIDMTHLYATWPVHVWRDSFMCDVTHSCATWLIHVRHDSFMCDMTQSCVTWLNASLSLFTLFHDLFARDMAHSNATWLLHTWLLHMRLLRPTQSVMYVPLQVNRFAQSILLIVQYRYLKSCSGDFYSPESDPPHKIMRYWFYYSIWLGFSFPPDRICQVEMICIGGVPVSKRHFGGAGP